MTTHEIEVFTNKYLEFIGAPPIPLTKEEKKAEWALKTADAPPPV